MLCLASPTCEAYLKVSCAQRTKNSKNQRWLRTETKNSSKSSSNSHSDSPNNRQSHSHSNTTATATTTAAQHTTPSIATSPNQQPRYSSCSSSSVSCSSVFASDAFSCASFASSYICPSSYSSVRFSSFLVVGHCRATQQTATATASTTQAQQERTTR